jgi:hypothetical protein
MNAQREAESKARRLMDEAHEKAKGYRMSLAFYGPDEGPPVVIENVNLPRVPGIGETVDWRVKNFSYAGAVSGVAWNETEVVVTVNRSSN